MLCDEIFWKDNKVDGEQTIIIPPDGAYDILYDIDREKVGMGYENNWTDNIGGYIHS